MKLSNFYKLTIAIIVSELAGVIGSLFTFPAIGGWYANLTRPNVAPPNWIFGPVWTTLFLLMGIAAFLVWKKGFNNKNVRKALALFAIQLVLNALWSIIFFGLNSLGGALIELFVLWVAIVATIFAFARVSKAAAWLMIPYILWVTFAAYLNFSFWILN